MRLASGWALGLVVFLLTAGTCRADAITEKVLQAVRVQAPELHVTAKPDDELEITGGKSPLTLYLSNIRTACAARPEHCDEEVASFVRRATSVNSTESTFVPEKVYAVLRSAGFGKRTSEAFTDADKRLVALPFIDAIEVLFVIDGDKAMRYVGYGEMVGVGLTESALLELASRNAARLPQLRYEALKGVPGVYFMPANDGLGTSRAFDSALWDKVEATAGGPVAVAMPTRDWVLFARADQPEPLGQLRKLAARIVRGEAYPVSDAMMVRDGKGWKALQ
jgi:uncharacterized protein YtpQ (UPF0354 family)